jgi:hypothetical protein
MQEQNSHPQEQKRRPQEQIFPGSPSSYNPDSGTEFIPNTFQLWENGAFFSFFSYYTGTV